MPKEEKETSKKKFKVMTEEVGVEPQTNTEPVTEEVKEVVEEKPIEAPVDEVAKEEPKFGVRETDNIDLNSKHKERGAFIKIFMVTFFATLLAFLLAGGIYVYLTGTNSSFGLKKNDTVSTPTPVAEVSTEPSATPQANVDLSTYKVSVLNGNGGIGVATAAKNIIEKVGFKVSSIGNADNFNFTDTQIAVKSTVSADVVGKLKDALSANYSVKIGDTLDAASNYDIIVTVGSK